MIELPCGLRSQVRGDAQIFSQAKQAYRLAAEEGRVGTHMHRLLHTAFRAAKRVRNETPLLHGQPSVAHRAVAAADRYLAARGGLDGHRVLVVGTGEMGQAALRQLATRPLAALAVTNRTPVRTQKAANAVGATLVPWQAHHAAAAAADIVLVATGARTPVLRADQLAPRPADQIPTLLIDLAMPRNVEPAVRTCPGYRLLDLEALRCTEPDAALHHAVLPAARAICEEELAAFSTWYAHHEVLQPALAALTDTFEAIRVQEVARHAHRFGATDQAELDTLTRSIMQKLLAVPVVRMKDGLAQDLEAAITLLAHLFTRPDCDDASEAEEAAVRCALHDAAPSGNGTCSVEVSIDEQQHAEPARVVTRDIEQAELHAM